MRLLTDNSEINKTIAQINKLEPTEAAQPVRGPSPADLVLDTVKEDKW